MFKRIAGNNKIKGLVGKCSRPGEAKFQVEAGQLPSFEGAGRADPRSGRLRRSALHEEHGDGLLAARGVAARRYRLSSNAIGYADQSAK